jgi:hypothetical protein
MADIMKQIPNITASNRYFLFLDFSGFFIFLGFFIN